MQHFQVSKTYIHAIRLCKVFRILESENSVLLEPFNPGTFCFWNRESRALEFVIQLKESGIPLTIGIHDLSSTDKKSGYQYLQSESKTVMD